MVNFAFGVPYRPPAPAVSPWTGIEMWWTGWDGSEWALTDPESGRFLRPGLRGLLMPEYERHSTSSSAVPGSRHRGTSTLDREVFWPLHEYSDLGSKDFMEWNRAFWRTMDPDREGTWRIVLPNAEVLKLGLKLLSVEDGLNHDPVKSGWLSSAITLVADSPYWRGQTVRRSWGQSDPKNYYVTDADRAENGWGPDVIHYLSSGMEIGETTFTNKGDVEAYPVWTAVGSPTTTSVTFGVAGAVVKVPFSIPAGYAVQLDTDPLNGQVLWYGQWDEVAMAIINPLDRTASLDPTSRFMAIPAGEDRQLSITFTGTGQVMAEVTPLFRRAI